MARKPKRKSQNVGVVWSPEWLDVIDDLKKRNSFASRAQVMRTAVAQMYARAEV